MRRLLCLFVWALLLNQAVAQDALVTNRWFSNSTDNFTVFSQLSRRQTERQLIALEQWRNASLQLLEDLNLQASAPITTYLYIFSNADDFALFSDGNDPAYFFSSPRANFIIMQDSENGLKLAKHHYAHFLLNNRTQGFPRWYEEGMSHYLSRIDTGGRTAQLQRISEDEFKLIASLNEAIALEDLFYDDSVLASPRLLQIANLKAGFFVSYLLHAHEREGFDDRTAALKNYLDLLDQGRNERFAFDQSFDSSMRSLARNFRRYLDAGQRRSERDKDLFDLSPIDEIDTQPVSTHDKRLWLAELSLHSGRFLIAAFLFDSLIATDQASGRAYSGYADAVRMNSLQTASGEFLEEEAVVLLYQQALQRSPEDYQVHLDFGQYYDAKRNSCEPQPSEQESVFFESEMQKHFQQAMVLNPEDAEVNLSYAQTYLFAHQDWRAGVAFQDKAFALLPSDTFVQEQAVEYALRESDFEYAQTLIDRLARPLHYWGPSAFVEELRMKLRAAQRSEPFNACAEANTH